MRQVSKYNKRSKQDAILPGPNPREETRSEQQKCTRERIRKERRRSKNLQRKVGRFEQTRDYEADGKAVRKKRMNASELFLFARDYLAGRMSAYQKTSEEVLAYVINY